MIEIKNCPRHDEKKESEYHFDDIFKCEKCDKILRVAVTFRGDLLFLEHEIND